MKHKLKIKEQFADAIMDGRKRFEVRENDRGFNAGDEVEFQCVNDILIRINHPINGKAWRISYVLSGWGIETGHVVFGIEGPVPADAGEAARIHTKIHTLEDVLLEMLDRHSDGVGMREFQRDLYSFIDFYAGKIHEMVGGEK